MKSFFVVALLLIFISIACSSYKSASSPTPANSNAVISEASSQPPSAIPQEKTPCTLTLAGAPVIKGLRLGMTPDEVLALFPGSKDNAEVRSDLSRPPNRFGGSSFVIRPGEYKSKPEFSEVSQITFSVLDGRISKINIGYNGPEWRHVDKFIEKLVDGTNLPGVAQWEAHVGLEIKRRPLLALIFRFVPLPGGRVATSTMS